jgi:hypothetical protein
MTTKPMSSTSKTDKNTISDSDSDDSDSEEVQVDLGDKLIFLKNPDKLQDVDRVDTDSNARFSLPFRCIIAGSVNSGKSTMAINVILQRQCRHPKFDEIHIVHGCLGTKEYDCIAPTSIRHQIPHYSDFKSDSSKRILVVYDDIEFTKMTKADLRKIVEITRLGSHLGISSMFVNQLFVRIPKSVRDNCNAFVLYRPLDLDSLNLIGRRIGLVKAKVTQIFDDLLPDFHDNLLVNYTKNAKHRYAKNLYEKIDLDLITKKKIVLSI